jgi:SAM-dependent methyltransferase
VAKVAASDRSDRVGLVLTRLDRVIPAAPGRPDIAGVNHPMRQVTVDIAAGRGWDADRAADVAALFDGLAPGWSERVASEGAVPLGDALSRGGVPADGPCVEIGSGTGNLTPVLAGALGLVVCVDLSREMLLHAPANPGHRVRADAARLPVRSGAVGVVALINAFLFPVEVDRVLRPNGVIVWVSTLGDQTPIYLPPQQVLDSLPGHWEGATSQAGWGEWLVARRSGRSAALHHD